MSFWQYILENKEQILRLLIEHINLTTIAVVMAILIGVPLGIFISYVSKASKFVLSIANIIQAVPSMALLGFMIPIFGIGEFPAIVAVVLYSLLPIVKNTFTGIHNINAQTLEAAKGIGLTPMQVLFRVQIPLALPVIMTGIRVTSVTAVGLMTIASFIGAGGLGYLVFSGISTVNANQILAGAIPACLLALLVDFILGLLEKIVTPISLQNGNKENNKKNRKIQKAVLSVIMAILVFIIGITSIGSFNKSDKVITIASKGYTEQKLLSNIVAELIEHKTDIVVDRKFGLGDTNICFGALKSGSVDMYIEYTGTAINNILRSQDKVSKDSEEVYREVKKQFKEQYGVEVLPKINFNNSYALATTKEIAEKYNLKTISDLAKVAQNLRFGIDFDFNDRPDGLKGVKNFYGFEEKSSDAYDSALKYVALTSGNAEIIDVFTTDGLLQKYNLVTLEDDKHFFTSYYPIPVIREEVLNKYPEIQTVLSELSNVLTDKKMSELNYKVDVNGENPKNVAVQFLEKEGLI